MPVRSLNSSVIKWPDTASVDEALRVWANSVSASRPDVFRVGYIGSHARGDWGVGSDLDVIIIVETAAEPFERRSLKFDLSVIPVPVDLLVYTRAEWQTLAEAKGKFWSTVDHEAVWVYQREK